MVHSMVSSVVSHHRDSMSDHSMVLLFAGLGVEGEGDLLTAWLSNDDLLLVNSVGGIDELGNIEALVVNLVRTDNLSDGDVLDDTDLLGSRVGQTAGDLQRCSDKRNLVGLGLVFLMTHLVFTMVVRGGVTVATISTIGWRLDPTGGHLHSLRALLVSDLSGGARSSDILPLVHIGADLPLDHSVGLLTDGEHTVEAVVIVHHLLHCQGHWGHLLSEGRDTHLGIDRGVGISAEQLRGGVVAIVGGRGQG